MATLVVVPLSLNTRVSVQSDVRGRYIRLERTFCNGVGWFDLRQFGYERMRKNVGHVNDAIQRRLPRKHWYIQHKFEWGVTEYKGAWGVNFERTARIQPGIKADFVQVITLNGAEWRQFIKHWGLIEGAMLGMNLGEKSTPPC